MRLLLAGLVALLGLVTSRNRGDYLGEPTRRPFDPV